MRKNVKVTVLGAGPAGISTAYHLSEKGIDTVVYEQRNDYGGLCGSFEIDGFRFDRFAHLTFSKNQEVNEVLEGKTSYLKYQPEALNYYEGQWIRNPVQYNLAKLSTEEKISIIKDFVNASHEQTDKSYDAWLKANYGEYFTEHFTAKYTRKYWTVNPDMLETKWIQNRMYVPTLEEILYSAFEEKTPNVHYSKEMHYPVSGGFRQFLTPLIEKLDIRYGKQIVELEFDEKRIHFADGTSDSYDELVTTLPLTELTSMDKKLPDTIKNEIEKLDYTSGYMVSIGLKKVYDFPTIWFYIYDEDILPARVYFPHLKSKDNVPEGCSSLQAEIYVSKYKKINLSDEQILNQCVHQLSQMGLFELDEVIVKDIRFEKYANIMFSHDIYEAREKVKKYLEQNDVYCVGRFAEWDYLWLEQSILHGKRVAEQVIHVGDF